MAGRWIGLLYLRYSWERNGLLGNKHESDGPIVLIVDDPRVRRERKIRNVVNGLKKQ